MGTIGQLGAHNAVTDEGKPIVLANADNYKWPNEAYVRDHIMPTEASLKEEDQIYEVKTSGAFLAENLKGKDAMQAASEQSRYDQIMDHLVSGKQDSGFGKVAVTGEKTGFLESKEGDAHLYLNEDNFKAALASDNKLQEFIGSIEHERSHARHGDYSAASLLAQQDNASLTREIEARADVEGSGPLGTHNAETKARYFKNYTQSEIPDYLEQHPGTKMSALNPSDQDLRAVSAWIQRTKDPKHPAPMDRVDALQESAKLMKAYEAANPDALDSVEGRQKESAFIVDKVLSGMKDRIDKNPGPDPVSPRRKNGTPPLGLNQGQMDSIKGISGLFNKCAGPQEFHDVSSPVTSASAVPITLPDADSLVRG